MKIRNLKRKSGETLVSVWPPVWSGWYKPGDKLPVGEEGVLQSVKRIGDRLSLTMTYEGRDHMASLQWDAPPLIEDVEGALRDNCGKTMKGIADLDVPDTGICE